MPRWSAEARKKQAERIRQQKPWCRSTGPKSAAGKARSAMNAYKHGHYTGPAKEMRALLRAQTHLLRDMQRRAVLSKYVIPNGAQHRRNLTSHNEISRFAQDDRNETSPRTHAPSCRDAQIGIESYPQFYPHPLLKGPYI